MKRKLKVNDFFCGCGGMGIAFKNAGYEIAGAWDFDKYAVESYRANVGDHVQKADIKELHQADIPQADVWAFGFPCQDLSVAGKQRGMILKCEDCGEEIEINPEEYTGNTICPKCSSNNFKAASRSGCFFEMMRLLEETEREREHAMPAVIIAENVRGLRPYLPVLRLEYERHGYTAHIEMFNSKYWNVPQNRDRVRITKGRVELFAGYLGNLVHMAEYEALMAEEVTRIKEKVDITHKRYKELGLMQPLHPEETPNYSFSDLQLTIYREIILKSEE